LTFGISYGDDIDTARAVIQKVVDANPTIQHDRGVEIFVKELGDSSVNFAVRVWVKHEDYWDVYFYMHEQVKKAFDREGVNIPFPQVDVHMKGN
ncbi:MAG: mechanosensitive ion channel, partial [Saprospiraceae bacterium]|nr:mechanosensitive ion channel [Saprospiraceae bacterium]